MAPPAVNTRLRIETPENVLLEFRLAGPASRMLAYVLDLAICGMIACGCIFVLNFIAPLMSFTAFPVALVFLLLFFLEWGYRWAFEGFWGGLTPGKRAVGLRVVKVEGYPISFYDAMLRNLLRAADLLPMGYGVGLVSVMITRKMQRLGDLVAGTIVVREERSHQQSSPPSLRKVEPIPPSQLTSGYRPSDRTLEILDRFFRRARGLNTPRAREIASILAVPLADRLGYANEDEPLRSPLLFLRRILKTFAGEDYLEDAGVRKKNVRRRSTSTRGKPA